MNDNHFLSTEDTAKQLGISKASLKNWEKHGLILSAEKGRYRRSEVENLISRINSGEIDRLNRRANKRKIRNKHIPGGQYAELCRAASEIQLPPETVMFLVSIRLFIDAKIISPSGLERLLRFLPEDYATPVIMNHLKNHCPDKISPALIDGFNIISGLDFPAALPADSDIAGTIYQSIKNLGSRSKTGTFYTPAEIADAMVESALSRTAVGTAERKKVRMLDPCCGTGQFLLSFIKKGGRAENAFGIDSDPAAAFTAASNILLQCPDIESPPHIFCADSLLDELSGFQEFREPYFDLAATNPPWGACTAQNREKLALRYPGIKSGESFSYFICRCLELVKPGGITAFVLPESFATVGRHSEIRKQLLEKAEILNLENRGRIFSNVFTPAVTVEAEKRTEKTAAGRHGCNGWRFKINSDYSFSINFSAEDSKLIDRIYRIPHFTLKNNADWALGIVTGDNKRFLSDQPAAGYEPVIRGCEIKPGSINEPQKFIRYEPEIFQQIAPEWKYREADKIVYRFINKRLVFAVDKKMRLVLNSANIVLPDNGIMNEWNISREEIVSFFNSDISSFIFRKRFNSVKILRSHLEELPVFKYEKLSSVFSKKELEYIAGQL